MRYIEFAGPHFAPGTPPDHGRFVLNVLLEALTMINEDWYRRFPSLPGLYDSGTTLVTRNIDYMREPIVTNVYGNPESREHWQDVMETRERKSGDCEDLAADRAAELRVRYGIRANAVFKERMLPNGTRMFHIVVEYPDGTIEDPSKILGMGGPRDLPAENLY